MVKKPTDLTKKHRASEPCTCLRCLSYCMNIPGLWTVAQCRAALEAGMGHQMMLRLPPGEHGILSPAIKGCEGRLLDRFKMGRGGCVLLQEGRCKLHTTPYKPLECRVTSHDRGNAAKRCHDDIVQEWDSPEGQALVMEWVRDYLSPDEHWYVIEELGAIG